MIEMVMGTNIELINEINQKDYPTPYDFPKDKLRKIDAQVTKLTTKGEIVKTGRKTGDFISNIFARDKPDGFIRIILDLSVFNDSVKHRHFKMDTLNTTINLLSKGCFMVSIDWKDAYYSVLIATAHVPTKQKVPHLGNSLPSDGHQKRQRK